jgi:hypothetical protein
MWRLHASAQRAGPLSLKASDICRESFRLLGGFLDGEGELSDPAIDLVGSEVLQAGDVGVLVPAQHQRNRWHVARRNPTSLEEHMDEAAANTAIAVAERMDRLELGMRDRRLRDGRDVVSVHELAEIGDQGWDVFMRRWDEHGMQRRSAADPSLRPTDLPGDPAQRGGNRKRPVDGADVIEVKVAGLATDPNRRVHSSRIAQDLLGEEIARLAFFDFRPGKLAVRELQPLDRRRGKRLRPNQLAAHTLERKQGHGRAVQLAYGSSGPLR